MIVEVCANGLQSAINAQLGGAHRIELCEDLSVGGLTPSYKLVGEVLEAIEIPIHVLVRPRKGDFIYTVAEIDRMVEVIAHYRNMGVHGIVCGALTPNNKLDTVAMKSFREAAGDLYFTFHRAFDVCADPNSTLEKLIALEVDCLLSSGLQISAVEGMETLEGLLKISEEKIMIMPGGGLNSSNTLPFKKAGFKAVHLSAIPKKMAATTLFENSVEGISDLKEIQKVVRLLS